MLRLNSILSLVVCLGGPALNRQSLNTCTTVTTFSQQSHSPNPSLSTHPISKEKSQMHINLETQNSFHDPTSPNSAPSLQSQTPRPHKSSTSGSQFSTTLSNNLFILLYRPKEMS
ncbi:hypothetical protein M438DRAFT_348859 [Aureobasidium pullulans EXF-150]|uniref:Uncharacterized protein n=1 Tax=Aureobasidium pullulans EXF-150 TaxID=1043002 RepID=A0A074X4C5_AURPU|nr:uncharacterized protein M438DRAFT_348859 [Aureobasidium pullulans EXF-150]KEQ80365.1 hypothetical protein M438DRAFT_348859 [Aureobasidium pullulans EXF-150]